MSEPSGLPRHGPSPDCAEVLDAGRNASSSGTSRAGGDGTDHFHISPDPDPHLGRAKQILAAHPALKKLFGRDPVSGMWTGVIVALQLAIAIGLAMVEAPWWAIVGCAYIVGAFANIALLILIHEYTHNLVFRGSTLNRLGAIVANVPILFPAAMGFRTYHLLHHKHMGVRELDGDLPSDAEAAWVGNSTARKLLWVLMFWFVQGVLRPNKTTGQRTFDRWTTVNLIAMLAIGGGLILAFGIVPVAYLGLSTIFAVGLHPVGGRWFQEHYVLTSGQETYSYYGPLNRILFNVGYHNEHHDLPGIPWSRLPAVRATAREFYDPLHHYTSWTGLLVRIITDPQFRPHLRIVRHAKPAK